MAKKIKQTKVNDKFLRKASGGKIKWPAQTPYVLPDQYKGAQREAQKLNGIG